MDRGFLNRVVVGDALYLLAGAMIGCTLLLPAAGVRLRNDNP
jgi:hypothetical protein